MLLSNNKENVIIKLWVVNSPLSPPSLYKLDQEKMMGVLPQPLPPTSSTQEIGEGNLWPLRENSSQDSLLLRSKGLFIYGCTTAFWKGSNLQPQKHNESFFLFCLFYSEASHSSWKGS